MPERDRLGRLEIRYDPRDISRVYVRDPSDGQFRVTPLTLWEHRRARSERRSMRARTGTEKVGVSREIAAIVAAARARKAQTPRASKGEARDLVRATRAAEAVKPYEAMEAAAAPAAEPHPPRVKRLLPIEDW